MLLPRTPHHPTTNHFTLQYIDIYIYIDCIVILLPTLMMCLHAGTCAGCQRHQYHPGGTFAHGFRDFSSLQVRGTVRANICGVHAKALP